MIGLFFSSQIHGPSCTAKM